MEIVLSHRRVDIRHRLPEIFQLRPECFEGLRAQVKFERAGETVVSEEIIGRLRFQPCTKRILPSVSRVLALFSVKLVLVVLSR